MVKLNEVKTLNAALVAESGRGRPLVAVFLGGTSGIGHMTARALASAAQQQAGPPPRIYLAGRSAQRGEAIVEELRGLCPAGTYRFVRAADLSLMAGVDDVCAEIMRLERQEEGPRIDYLMTSQGGAIFQPRRGIWSPFLCCFSYSCFSLYLRPILRLFWGVICHWV